MKNIIIVFLFFSFNCSISQNYYDVYVIEKNNNNGTISTLDVAQKIGDTQTQLQNRYDYNNQRINNAINDISNKILKLNYNDEIKNSIGTDFNSYINDVNNHFKKNKNDILNNSSVTNLINYLYQSVNNSISKRVQEYNDNLKPQKNENLEVNNIETALDFLKLHKGGYDVKIYEYEYIKGEWKIIAEDFGHVVLNLQSISFYRNSTKQWNFRELMFSKYNEERKEIVFYSHYGNTNIDINFRGISFENLLNIESKENPKFFLYEIIKTNNTLNPK